jgi:hypothetical protein
MTLPKEPTMMRRKPAPAPQPGTLAQQKADFTAEGSPPPRKAATSVPVTTDKTAPARAPTRATPARKGPPVDRTRWQR